jgi:hypothetical protein
VVGGGEISKSAFGGLKGQVEGLKGVVDEK